MSLEAIYTSTHWLSHTLATPHLQATYPVPVDSSLYLRPAPQSVGSMVIFVNRKKESDVYINEPVKLN